MEVVLGSIVLWPGPWIPKGWLLCDGSILPIAPYQALFSLIGTRYGGDGRTTFALPDLRNAVVVGSAFPQDAGRRISVPDKKTEGGEQAPAALADGALPHIVQNWIISMDGVYPNRD